MALAGKEVAEHVDPTEEDAEWRKKYRARPYVEKGTAYETYQPAYQYGVEAHTQHSGQAFVEVESDLRRGWTKTHGHSVALARTEPREAVRDAYDRTLKLHEEELHAHVLQVPAGEVRVRKEVITEQKTLNVPVEREEVVIERRPVTGRRAAGGDIRAEEVRVPLRTERASAEKRTVVKEEVQVGKRTVQETQKVSGTVRNAQLKVEKPGGGRVRSESKVSRARR